MYTYIHKYRLLLQHAAAIQIQKFMLIECRYTESSLCRNLIDSWLRALLLSLFTLRLLSLSGSGRTPCSSSALSMNAMQSLRANPRRRSTFSHYYCAKRLWVRARKIQEIVMHATLLPFGVIQLGAPFLKSYDPALWWAPTVPSLRVLPDGFFVVENQLSNLFAEWWIYPILSIYSSKLSFVLWSFSRGPYLVDVTSNSVILRLQ